MDQRKEKTTTAEKIIPSDINLKIDCFTKFLDDKFKDHHWYHDKILIFSGLFLTIMGLLISMVGPSFIKSQIDKIFKMEIQEQVAKKIEGFEDELKAALSKINEAQKTAVEAEKKANEAISLINDQKLKVKAASDKAIKEIAAYIPFNREESTVPEIKEIEMKKSEDKTVKDYIALADKAWKEAEYKKGLDFLEKGSKLKAADDKQKASLKYGFGLIYLSMGKIRLAINSFNEALSSDPDKSEAYADLGIAYYLERNYMEAEKYINKAIKLVPDKISYYSNLSAVYSEQGQYVKAEEILKLAISKNSNDSDLHHNLGNILSEQGKDIEAEKQYKEAIKLGSNNSIYLNSLMNFYIDRPNFNK